MTKKDFLDKLREKLEILKSDEVEDIINEYSEHIDEKVKSGVSEEDAILEFGDFNELVTNNIKYQKCSNSHKNTNNSITYNFINHLKYFFSFNFLILFHKQTPLFINIKNSYFSNEHFTI